MRAVRLANWLGSVPGYLLEQEALEPGIAPAEVGGTALARQAAMTLPLLISFLAGATGAWRIERVHNCRGETLPTADYLDPLEGEIAAVPANAVWRLTGFTAELRYTTGAERGRLAAAQEGLGRPDARRAALIPIRKSAAWWNLPQDERRAIFEERSRHISIGLDYLPAVARRLHHCRGLGEPFDFLTWFEYAPADAHAFDAMLARLRSTEEWCYVEREVDIRLIREEQ